MPASYADISAAAEAAQLQVMGGFHPIEGDLTPEGCRSLIMLGPLDPGFWDVLTASVEYQDGAPDPVDRWSARVIGDLAETLGARPLFPFGGPPYLPFIRWAERTGRVWPSPVGLLVHDRAGLWASFRGALAFDHVIAIPPAGPSPCLSCTERPCLTACPVGALGHAPFDVNSCHSYLNSTAGHTCMSRGCAVRRACPVSKNYPRAEAQSAYHMSIYHR